jgi:ubiquitin-conjugating enzyme E2 Z
MSKRTLADIAELQNDLYKNQGIFYEADEQTAQHGYALVFGPEGTPYEDCPMFYEFQIPQTFPFDNPKVEFRTYDGLTRFHPNMYKEGKCCLSILGTWEGPRWASTMRLSTILITLQSLMDTQPIRHEPGYANETGQMGADYAQWVEHACMQYIVKHAEQKAFPGELNRFWPIFEERLPKLLARLRTRLEARVDAGEKKVSVPYSMSGTTKYQQLLERVKALCDLPT